MQCPKFDGLVVRTEPGCVYVTMSRPASGNSLTLQSAAELLDAVRYAADAGAKVLVLSGDERSWCVGGDIREFDRVPDRRTYIDDLAEALHRVVSELIRMDAVVVAAVDGVAAGAGMPLAAAADILVASERARFTLGYTKIGLTPNGGTTLLTSTLGLHRTLYQALMNPILTAAQAQELGLVARVAPAEDFADAVKEVVTVLRAGPAEAMAATKHLIRNRAIADAEAALRQESLAVRHAAAAEEAAEGIAAFLNKRRPQYL
ncbi:enoyl-CoA hydratase/isomerase family protein [Streptomyces sp. NPDC056296]|uniref:enoyl-CoA hydratase/isomerase family protein n=1 Tax=Streptomyces sp. NPDC056296 TaxID=3345775 RepID=UPI0035E183BB